MNPLTMNDQGTDDQSTNDDRIGDQHRMGAPRSAPASVGREAGGYFLISVGSFAVDVLALTVLEWAGTPLLLAGAVAFAIGVTTNYFLAVRFVFRRRKLSDRPGSEFAAYFMVGIVGLGVNELVLWGLAHRLGVHFLIAKCVSGIAVLITTFILRRTLIFSGED